MRVVVPEIASELGTEFGFGQEPDTLHAIGFEKMKERFHVSVAVWNAPSSHELRLLL